MTELRQEIAKAGGVIIDLRDCVAPETALQMAGITDLLPARELRGPSYRHLVHSGYKPQGGFTSGGYSSAFQTTHSEVFKPAME